MNVNSSLSTSLITNKRSVSPELSLASSDADEQFFETDDLCVSPAKKCKLDVSSKTSPSQLVCL